MQTLRDFAEEHSSPEAYWMDRASRAEQEVTRLTHEYERLLDWQDRTVRALQNPNVSPIYRQLYISLVDTYPDLLNGLRIPVQVHKVRYNAGGMTERSATNFFQDMQAIGAFQYDAGDYNPKENERLGQVTPNPDLLPYPERFSFKGTERKRQAKEADEKRRHKNAALILECELCGSPAIEYGLTARCKSCGHTHATIEHIDAERITVTDAADEQPTQPIPAQPPARVLEPIPLPQKVTTIPRCRHFLCINGPNRVRPRLSGLYCESHRGYVDERGNPL